MGRGKENREISAENRWLSVTVPPLHAEVDGIGRAAAPRRGGRHRSLAAIAFRPKQQSGLLTSLCCSHAKAAVGSRKGYDRLRSVGNTATPAHRASDRDLETWLGAFARFQEAREKAGVRAQRRHQPVDDDKYIYGWTSTAWKTRKRLGASWKRQRGPPRTPRPPSLALL